MTFEHDFGVLKANSTSDLKTYYHMDIGKDFKANVIDTSVSNLETGKWTPEIYLEFMG